MSDTARIKPKDRDAILQALRAGVVPRLGLQHIQVGRAREVEEVLRDVERIGQGGAAIRFVIGEYGAGKTFFLNLTRLIGLEKRLVVINADLAPDRRLHASGGQARGLYAELLRNMATRTKPDGGALPSVVERFIGDAHKAAKSEGRSVEEMVQQRLAPLEELVSGFDFTTVLTHYWKASEEGSEAGKSAALRWLRAEYSTRTEARQALGVRDIIDDTSFYDYLKLLARFVVIAGYDGLLIVLDEMVNLYKLTSTQARSSNYEQILRILNDVLQGSAAHVGFLLGGTPEFLMDPRRGLYSYPALQSRLAENRFARDGLVDLSGPVIRLQNLTPEDLYVLLNKLRHIHAGGDPARHAVPDEALTAFMDHCSKRIGDAYFRTPRNSVTAFVDLLAVLEQNPAASWRQLLGTLEVAAETPVADAVAAGEDDELASFKL
ncbi:ATP-binding protein [Azospirillum argentinense]